MFLIKTFYVFHKNIYLCEKHKKYWYILQRVLIKNINYGKEYYSR